MKQWLNNWEKFIGERLRSAQTKPDSYVWDLIEQDLDTQPPKRRPAVIRIIAAMAALFLLVTVSGILLMNSPSGNLALFDISNQIIQPESSQWVITSSSLQDQNLQIETHQEVIGNVAETIITEKIRISDGQINNVATVSVISPSAPSIEEVNTIRDLVVVDLKDESIDQLKQLNNDEVFLSPGIAVSLVNQPEDYRLQLLESSIKQQVLLYTQEILNRIAANTGIENHILVKTDQPEIHAYQNITQLSLHSTYVDDGSTEMSFEEHSLTVDRSILAYWEVIEPQSEILIAKANKGEVTEVLEINQAKWIQEAFNELEGWKESLNEQSEQSESKALEELIEEAILDEEDPLTKRQNEAKDLYRASNINKGFHVGVVSAYQNTWVTRATRNPEVDRSVVKYKFNAGYQVGINMGYDFTNHFGLMMEFKYSNEGGRYYNPLKQRDQHLDLRYVEIPLYAKVKHSKLTEKMRPIVFNYILGVTYSDLRKINVRDGGIDKRFGQDYNTTEWGLSAGFDFDYYFNKNLFWTVGARAGVSGNAKSFPKFKGEDGQGAMSIDAGLYTRLNFRLPGK